MREAIDNWLSPYYPSNGRGALSFTLHNNRLVSSLTKAYQHFSDTPSVFELYERSRLSEENARIFESIEKLCQRKLVIFHRPVANFAPKYTEFKLFFEGESSDPLSEHVFGFGQSFSDPDVALSKAIGELVERYVFFTDWQKSTVKASATQLGQRVLLSEHQAYYQDWQHQQFPYLLTREAGQTIVSGWVRVRRLFGWRRAYAPASRIFWTLPNEAPRLNHPTSSGKAGGFSKTSASLGALLELVERDGFMCYWLHTLSPRKIAADTVTTPGYVSRRYFFERYKLEVYFFDTSSIRGIPCITCVVVDRVNPDDPKFSFGAAAGYNPDALFDGSLLEALVVQRNHWFTKPHQSQKIPPSFDELRGYFSNPDFDEPDLNARLRYWRGKEQEKKLAFWFSGPSVSFEDYATDNHLQSVDSERSAYRRTRRVFKNLARDFGSAYTPYVYATKQTLLPYLTYHTVCAVVPAVYPLYLVEFQAPLDIMKLKHWNRIYQDHKNDLPSHVTNLEPHPFP